MALKDRFEEAFAFRETLRFIQANLGNYALSLVFHLVARFASLHGGRSWVEDAPGGGASFRVYLPAAVRPSANRQPATGAPGGAVPAGAATGAVRP